MKATKKSIIIVLVSLLVTTSLIDIYGTSLLRTYSVFARFVPVKDLSTVQPHNDGTGLERLARDFQGNDPIVLLEQVMNTVQQVEPYSSRDVLEIYHHVLDGGGLVCGGMATLYWSVLGLKGIQARRVQLRRNILDIYDTHVTVEVLQGGKWVIYDPTFNVSFAKNGELIGAQEIKESLYDGSFTEVQPVFYGQVVYPARLEDYYMHWLSLFNNVSVIDGDLKSPIFTRFSPLRYWLGVKRYYEPINEQQVAKYGFQGQLYAGVVVVLPVIVCLLGFSIFAMLLAGGRKQER